MSEPDVSNLLTVAQAIAVIDAAAVAPRVIKVPIQNALGHYLARDILADRDYPPFDKSLMDGYAVRVADVARTPVRLSLIGEIAAGGQSMRALEAGQTMAIMTGAPIPPGADGVVPIEETVRDGEMVEILRAGDPQRFIARRGSDIAAGRVILRKGQRLESPQLAAAATVGAHHLEVYARPRVAVLSTGDEIIPVDATPAGPQIRNSNGLMLVALLERMGCEVTDLGIAKDQPEIIRGAIENAAGHDVLFVTGGMSMGAYDYVPRVLRELGYYLRITKLRIKPGKPFVFGVGEGSGFRVQGSGNSVQLPPFVFGLPGNPVSGFACTVRLASRLLMRLAGGEVVEKWIWARLSQALGANGPREFYQPAELRWTAEGPVATPLAWKGSADLFTLAQSNALLVRGENEGALEVGALVRVLEI